MKTIPFSLLAAMLSLSLVPFAAAEPAETEIPNVTAEVAELSTRGGVTRLAVRYVNGDSGRAETARFEADKIALVDVKSRHKHFPIRDANNQFVAGPIGDEIGGGRIYVLLEAGQQGVAWAYFDALEPGTVVSIEVPQMFPFEDVAVTAGPSTLFSAVEAKSIPAGALATLTSARRADEAFRVRLKLAAAAGAKVDLRSPYFEYKGVYLFDPAGKRKYPLLRDSEGIFQAQPLGQRINGGSFLPDWNKPILMSLTFPAPPDDVLSVDLILPDFQPFENVTIEGLGSAAGGGIATGGQSLGLEGALRELQAKVTPEEIKIDLSADVLFDFDQADLKPDGLRCRSSCRAGSACRSCVGQAPPALQSQAGQPCQPPVEQPGGRPTSAHPSPVPTTKVMIAVSNTTPSVTR